MRMERMIEQASVVEAMRGAVVESRHRLHVAVVDAGGRLRASAGDSELQTFFRSAAKPFQVLPMVAAGAVERYGITPDEIALCCGSHSGEPAHVRTAERLLARVGAAADALVCGSHPPFHHPTRQALADAGLEPGRLHNNCSGKHAGMIALARARGWEVEGYERIDHPVQGAVMEELSRWTRLPADGLQVGNDGCGVVSFALPLYRMALAYARLAADARQDPTGPGGTVVGAMTRFPFMVAGTGRVCTDLMRTTRGRVFAKFGAEGVYCMGVPGAELGIAIKVEDGARRALGPAAVEVLRQLALISEADADALEPHAFPELRNTRGVLVGQLRAALRLQTHDA
jgi:L-asparaginase II